MSTVTHRYRLKRASSPQGFLSSALLGTDARAALGAWSAGAHGRSLQIDEAQETDDQLIVEVTAAQGDTDAGSQLDAALSARGVERQAFD